MLVEELYRLDKHGIKLIEILFFFFFGKVLFLSLKKWWSMAYTVCHASIPMTPKSIASKSSYICLLNVIEVTHSGYLKQHLVVP